MSLFELQKKIKAALSVALIKNIAKTYDYIPEGVKMPFIVIGDDSAVEYKTKTFMGYEITSTIYVWGEEKSMIRVKNLLAKMSTVLCVDLDEFEFHSMPEMAAKRESVEYVKGTLQVKYRFEEE